MAANPNPKAPLLSVLTKPEDVTTLDEAKRLIAHIQKRNRAQAKTIKALRRVNLDWLRSYYRYLNVISEHIGAAYGAVGQISAEIPRRQATVALRDAFAAISFRDAWNRYKALKGAGMVERAAGDTRRTPAPEEGR